MKNNEKYYTILETDREDGVIIATIKHEPIQTFESRVKSALEDDFDSTVKIVGKINIEPLQYRTGQESFMIEINYCGEFYTYEIQIENTWMY